MSDRDGIRDDDRRPVAARRQRREPSRGRVIVAVEQRVTGIDVAGLRVLELGRVHG